MTEYRKTPIIRYRKRPVTVDAIRYDGTNRDEIADMLDLEDIAVGPDESLMIETLEGNVFADVGDWVIKGVAGEAYPCRADIFEQTYEAVRYF